MIYLKFCQAGERINHKRVERLYAAEKRRRGKKVPITDRQPMERPAGSNEAKPPESVQRMQWIG